MTTCRWHAGTHRRVRGARRSRSKPSPALGTRNARGRTGAHRFFDGRWPALARVPLIVGACIVLTSCNPVSVAVRPQEQTVEAGAEAVYDVDIIRISHQGPVSLGLSPAGSPHYTTALQPNPVTGRQSRLTVQVTPDAPIGAYEIEVTSNPPTRPPLYGVPPNRAFLVVGPCGARWIRQFGTAQSDNAWSIKLNANGDIFALSHQDFDRFAMRFDGDGRLTWADPVETTGGMASDLDPQGHLVIASRVVRNNMREYLLRRYTPFGTPDWTVTFGNDRHIDPVSGLATDAAGDIYLVGNTRGNLGGVNPDNSHTNSDGWVAKYDSRGNQIWLRQTETFEPDFYFDVAVDNAGAVYVRGARGIDTVFLRKFDATTGNVAWAEELPVYLAYLEGALAVDANRNVYVAFHQASPTALTDPVLMKYAPNQVRLWGESLESGGISVPLGIAIDATGEPIVVGRRMLSPNQFKGSVAEFAAANGAPAWNLTIDAPFETSANSIALDTSGDMYIAGETDGSFGGQNRGRTDAWLGKLEQGGCVL